MSDTNRAQDEVESPVFYGNYRGLVVDNLDPAGLGRIKVKVYPMFKDIVDPYLLPWATPAMGLFAGAGVGFGGFAVPAVDSFVYVFFEAGNIYQPVYFAEAQTAQCGVPLASQIDYPHSKVWQTPGGISIWINDKTGSEQVVVYHPSGSYFEMFPSGAVVVYADKSITVQAQDEDASLVAATKNVNLTAFKDINGIAGDNINLTASKAFAAKATTTAKVEAGGSVSISAGATASVSAVGAASLIGATAFVTAQAQAHVTGNAGVEIKGRGMTLKIALDRLMTALMAWRGTDPQGGIVTAEPSSMTELELAKTMIDTVLT